MLNRTKSAPPQERYFSFRTFVPTKSKLNQVYDADTSSIITPVAPNLVTDNPQPTRLLIKKSILLTIDEEEKTIVEELEPTIFDNFNNEMLTTLRSLDAKDKNFLAEKLDALVNEATREFKLAKAGYSNLGYSEHNIKLFKILDQMEKYINKSTDNHFIEISLKQIKILRENLSNALPSAQSAPPSPEETPNRPISAPF